MTTTGNLTIYAMALSVKDDEYKSEFHQCYVGTSLDAAIGEAELTAHALGLGQPEEDPYYFRALLTEWEDGQLKHSRMGSVSTGTWRFAFDQNPPKRPVL